jgi:Rrf2 family protein
MLRMSKKMEYALISMLHMSQKEPHELTTAKELAHGYNIPQELMGKVLQKLAKEGMVNSVQGVKGGYRLERSAGSIHLSEIYRALEGPMTIVTCIKAQDFENCAQQHFCNIRNPMEIIQQKLEKFFHSVTLKDLKVEMNKTENLAEFHLTK